MTILSVIVPVYNAADFLPNCLATIRANRRDGFQFIIIDDHSDDETPEILGRAAEAMPWLTLLRNPENSGVAKSRNIALTHAEGRYLTYLDADDWYLPGHLGLLLDAHRSLGVDFVRTDHVRVNGMSRSVQRAPDGERDVVVHPTSQIGAPGSRSMVDYPFLWAGMYDRERIAPELFAFDESLRTAADRPWFWRLHLNTESTAVLDLKGYFYRKDVNPTALTQAGNRNTLHFLDAYAGIRDLAIGSGNTAYIDKAAYGACRIVSFHVSMRARLTPDLQSELFRRSSAFLNSFPADAIGHALRHFRMAERIVLKKILQMEAR
ncbi:glycosyltransferase family 2 protein [Myceligenerans halotolerans]